MSDVLLAFIAGAVLSTVNTVIVLRLQGNRSHATLKQRTDAIRTNIANKIHPAHQAEPNESGPVRPKTVGELNEDKKKPMMDRMKTMFGSGVEQNQPQDIANDVDG